jgi:hypothetical protein
MNPACANAIIKMKENKRWKVKYIILTKGLLSTKKENFLRLPLLV